MATLPPRNRSKAPLDCRSTQGADVALSSGDSNPLFGQQTPPSSSAGTLKEQQQGRCCNEESKTLLPTRDVHIIDKQQLIRNLSEAKDGQRTGRWSRAVSPRTPRSKTGRGGDAKAVATLPPYIRATIAEQLAPLCTRPARENTQETLFGSAEPLPPSPRGIVRRPREDTQSTLFGESDPATVRKTIRQATDTQTNLFGPPPEFRRRQGVRFQTDTPDILRHDEGRRPSSSTSDARYDDRHQDTHEKLFGSPARQPCPQVQKPLSNIFYNDSKSSLRDKVVRSLPMSSLIADE